MGREGPGSVARRSCLPGRAARPMPGLRVGAGGARRGGEPSPAPASNLTVRLLDPQPLIFLIA